MYWLQATLPIRFGELGVRKISSVSLPAFLFSVHSTEKLTTRILVPAHVDSEVPCLTDAVNAWKVDSWAEPCPGRTRFSPGIRLHRDSAMSRSAVQVWSDWKTKTKKKAFVINRDIHGTGGEPGRGKPLSRLEERVLRVIGVTSITGNQAIQEAGFKEPSEPQVRHAADTAERVPSPVEIEYLTIPRVPEDTPTSVPADKTASPARPVSPVPCP